jgi:DNA polymerase epsilon subunit 4
MAVLITKFEADVKEYFIKHFMEEGYTKARLDRRKLVTYKDIGELQQLTSRLSLADVSYGSL